MEKIFVVTGANGHLGNTIVRMLIKDEQKVRVLVLPNDSIKPFEDLDCEIYYGDIVDKKSLKEILKVDKNVEVVVIHCAGIVSIASKYNQKVYNVNVLGTKNVVDEVMKLDNAKMVHVSSVHAIPEKKNNEMITEIVYFDPNLVEGLYAKTKSEATQYVLDKTKEGLNACVVHPSGIIGPYDYGHGHLTQMIIDYLEGRLTACVRGGYDFVDVRDVARGIINATKYGRVGECYILSNRYFDVPELLKELSDVSGKKRISTILPMWLAKATAPLAELYYKMLKQVPLYTKYSLFTLTSNANFSKEKAKEELDYINRDMKETLKDTVDWLVEHNRVPKYKKKLTQKKNA